MRKLAIALVLLRTLPALAQQGSTAEVRGRATAAGQALPGVSVTLTSPALQGVRTALTGDNGGYLFAFLPPADYQLRFDDEGFTPIEKRFHLSLAEAARMDVELQPAVVSETITVESSHAASAKLELLPVNRDIASTVLLSSNATDIGPHNGIIVAGAPSWDTLYLVDGAPIGEYQTGQPQDVVIEDAVEDISFQTSAIPAEYGRFTGGVVSTLTKSGGNEYRGSLRDMLTNSAWTASTPWTGQPAPGDHVNQKIEATLGGFAVRDRLWFFAAGRKAQTSLQSFTTQTNVPYTSSSQEERWQAKLTAHIASNHSLILSYADAHLDEQNAIDSRSSGVLDLNALIPVRRQPLSIVTGTYEGLVSSNTFVEVEASQKRFALQGNGGQSKDLILGTLIAARNVQASLNAPIGCGICGDDSRNSSAWSARVSRYEDTRLGNHTLIAGAEGFQEHRINAATRAASEYNIQAAAVIDGQNAYPRFDSSSLIVWNHPIPSDGPRFSSETVYANDRWDNAHISLNLGLRYDRNHAVDGVGQRVTDSGTFMPRLSATADIRGDGRHRIVASYGRYSSKILEGGGSSTPVGVFEQLGWRYLGPPINTGGGPFLTSHEALAKVFEWFDSIGGNQNRNDLVYFTDPLSTTAFPRSLDPPVVHEVTLGYNLHLPNGFIAADFVARDWKRFYTGRVDTATGQNLDAMGNPIDVSWVINDDKETMRAYRAVQLRGGWNRGAVSAGGTYTLSKLRGNDDEEEGTLNAPRNMPLSLWYPEFLNYPKRRPIGDLLQDQRHRARLWAGYTMPFARGTLAAFLLQSMDSGHPYSVLGTIDPTGLTPGTEYDGVPANPGYAFNQVRLGAYYFSARGAYRTDDVFSSDVAVTYDIPYQRMQLFSKAEVTNLFDRAAVVNVDTEVVTRLSNAGSGLLPFNPFTATPVEGINYRLGPNFGKPTGPESYQTPRTFRLSLGVRF